MKIRPRHTTSGYRVGALLLTLLGAAALPSDGHGAAPSCTAETAGNVAVQAGVRCTCRFVPASAMQATAAGHRWDCGINKARMNQRVPATTPAWQGFLPDAVLMDRVIINPGRHSN